VQLGEVRVAHEVRPQTAVRGPLRVVDENGHAAILRPTRGPDAFAGCLSVS
jgi:hypothetical protein